MRMYYGQEVILLADKKEQKGGLAREKGDNKKTTKNHVTRESKKPTGAFPVWGLSGWAWEHGLFGDASAGHLNGTAGAGCVSRF
jgi:hypothetical protein